MEEENSKLKKNLDKMSKEKTCLVDQMMKTSTGCDLIETKLETEIQDLKDVLLKEIQEVRNQVEKSMLITRPASTIESAPNVQPVPSNTGSTLRPYTQQNNRQQNNRQRTSQTTAVENRTQNKQTAKSIKTAFIAGDSLTRILSCKRMVDSNLDIKIKSHPGGKIWDIENTVINMAKDDTDFICNTDAVVVTAGSKNLSDGDPIEEAIEELCDLANTIRNINPECQIIISSILPRRNDKLANQIIRQTNQSLRQFCEKKSYHFLDQTDVFLSNGLPDSTLYQDNLYLNAKGGKVLGESIRAKLNSVLSLPISIARHQNSNQQEQNFQKGRNPGRRLYNNQHTLGRSMHNNQPMMYMPMPFFPQPWFQHNNQRNIQPHYTILLVTHMIVKTITGMHGLKIRAFILPI